MNRRLPGLSALLAWGLSVCLLGLAPAAAMTQRDACRKARTLFNRSLKTSAIAEEQRLLKAVMKLCRHPDVLGPVLNNLADTYERQGRLSRAFFYYKKAVSVKPDQAVSYFSAAHLYMKLGDAYSAYLVYQKGLRYDPDNQKARKQMQVAKEQYPKGVVVYFPFDSIRLTPQAARRLGLFLNVIRGYLSGDSDNAHCLIQIEGHTCDLGPRAYNKRLGLDRARAVLRYLKEGLHGKPVTFDIRSFGEDVPLIKAKDRIARKLNRRVTVHVLKGYDIAAKRKARADRPTNPDKR